MKDELELLWTGVKVRVKDTFTSTFFVAWVIWNWQAILYILYPMSMDLDARLSHIEANIYGDWIKSWGLLLIGPLLSTLFFLLVLPWLVNRIDSTYQGYLVTRRKAQVAAQATLYWTAEDIQGVLNQNKKLQLDLEEARNAVVKAEARIDQVEDQKSKLQQDLTARSFDMQRMNQNQRQNTERIKFLYGLLDDQGKGQAQRSSLWKSGELRSLTG